jgi:Fe-S-cluster containining protein
MPGSDPELDTDLLRGFHFTCRPSCGLCCFAEPRVEPSDRSGLLSLAPRVELGEREGASYVRARPNGGACQLLHGLRCSAHAGRPHACREFPVHVHLGTRLQASLVLSCPGVDLTVLMEDVAPGERPPARGLESELAAVRERVNAPVAARLEAARRRRARWVRSLTREGRWVSEESVRETLRRNIPLPGPANFPVRDLPSRANGLEVLPLYYDGRAGPVALSQERNGWGALELRPEGGVAGSPVVVPPPSVPPVLDRDAGALLVGYLRYFLERDLLFGSVVPRMSSKKEGTVTDRVSDELRRIGAVVMSRASFRARVAGASDGRLTRTQLEAGIRATDQDLLDVPTWGDRL